MLCDTNGGSLPARGRARSSPTCTATSATTSIIGIHCHDDTGCAVANSMAAVRAGARHVQGTLNGLGERTGNCNLTTVIPNLQLKLGLRVPARGPHRAAHRGEPPRRRGAQPAAQPAGAVRRRRRRSPTRPGCTCQRDRAGQGRLRARRPGARSATAPASSCQRDGRPGDDPDQGRRARPRRWTAPAVNQVIDDLKRLEHEGYHFEAADASLELLMRRAAGWEQEFFRVESDAGDHRRAAERRRSPPRPRSRCGSARVRRRAPRAHGRGQRPGQRHRHGAAGRASASRYPQLDRGPPDRLQGAHPRRGHGHRRRSPACCIDATDGERTWTTIGVSAEHHRGVVAGPRGEPRVRPAAQQVDIRPMAAPKFAPSTRPSRSAATNRPITCRTRGRRPTWRDRGVPTGGPASRLPGPGPGLRVAHRGHVAPEGAGRRRGERRRRDPWLSRGGAAPCVALIAGPGRASNNRPLPPLDRSYCSGCSGNFPILLLGFTIYPPFDTEIVEGFPFRPIYILN